MNLFVHCRGINYSPVNSDWTLNFKYVTVLILLYTIYSILYILIITYLKLRVNQNPNDNYNYVIHYNIFEIMCKFSPLPKTGKGCKIEGQRSYYPSTFGRGIEFRFELSAKIRNSG